MIFRQLIDYETKTFSYLLADPLRRKAVLIDPVLSQVERDTKLLEEMRLDLEYTIETGVHGDHLTSSPILRAKTRCQTIVPKGSKVQGADREVEHGEAIMFGLLALEARSVPGRTKSNMMYVTADLSKAFVGSALLIRDLSRVDHPDSDPRMLYQSIREQILTLPSFTELYPGRDFAGRTATSVGEERQHNPYFFDNPTEEEFLARLDARELPDRSIIDSNRSQNSIFPPPMAYEVPEPSKQWAPIKRSVTGIPEVLPEWVFDSERNYRIIDVRGLDEYTGDLGHIEGSELVTLNNISGLALPWDRRKKYVTVCRSGGRSGRAAALLEQMGFTQVASMAGGMLRWSELEYPVVKE